MASDEPRRPFSPVVLWLSLGFFFLFAGAAQQQFQSPYWGGPPCNWAPWKRSLILATVYLTFGFWRLRIGWFIRAWGEKTVLMLGSVTYVLFCLAAYLTTSYALLLAAAAMWGWGGAANWGTADVMVLEAARDRRFGGSAAWPRGATQMGWAIGAVVLNVAFRYGEGHDPSAARTVWLWAAMMSLVGVALLSRVPGRRTVIDPPSFRDQLRIMRSPKGAVASFFLFLTGMGFGVMLGFLADHMAFGLGGSRLYLSAFNSLAGGVAIFIGGPLSDRIGRPRSFVLTFTASAGGLLLAAALPHSVLAMGVCAMLLGAQGGLVPLLTLALIGDMTTRERRQNVYGAIFFWRDMGAAAALLTGQLLQQHLGIQDAMLAMAGVSVLCAGLAGFLSRRAEEQL